MGIFSITENTFEKYFYIEKNFLNRHIYWNPIMSWKKSLKHHHQYVLKSTQPLNSIWEEARRLIVEKFNGGLQPDQSGGSQTDSTFYLGQSVLASISLLSR